MEMSVFEVYGVLGTGILIMIASGSVFILVNSWYGMSTNKRLNKLEKGQAKLETELTEIKKNQAKLEKGQTELEAGQAKLEKGQAELESKIDEIMKLIKNTYNLLEIVGKASEKGQKNKGN